MMIRHQLRNLTNCTRQVLRDNKMMRISNCKLLMPIQVVRIRLLWNSTEQNSSMTCRKQNLLHKRKRSRLTLCSERQIKSKEMSERDLVIGMLVVRNRILSTSTLVQFLIPLMKNIKGMKTPILQTIPDSEKSRHSRSPSSNTRQAERQQKMMTV